MLDCFNNESELCLSRCCLVCFWLSRNCICAIIRVVIIKKKTKQREGTHKLIDKLLEQII